MVIETNKWIYLFNLINLLLLNLFILFYSFISFDLFIITSDQFIFTFLEFIEKE